MIGHLVVQGVSPSRKLSAAPVTKSTKTDPICAATVAIAITPAVSDSGSMLTIRRDSKLLERNGWLNHLLFCEEIVKGCQIPPVVRNSQAKPRRSPKTTREVWMQTGKWHC